MQGIEPRGAVLDPAAAAAAFAIARHPPGAALAPFVRHYWFLRWDLRERPPHRQGTLAVPAVNAVVEADTDSVSGVWTRRFDRTLTDRGAVFGVLFRPAGFWPFARRSMHVYTDRAVRFGEVFAGDVAAVRAVAFGEGSDAAVIEALEAFLLAEGPQRSAEAEQAGGWVDYVERNAAIGRAEALADAMSVSLRTLQRGLRRFVGVGPKQVIRRYRLLEASARLGRGEALDQTELALRLGYADQAHFVRDFAAVVGRPPGRYGAAQRGNR